MKKLLLLVAALFLVLSLSACKTEEFTIAMITDSGSIDDQSFNQGTWEGIVEFAEANEISHKYYKPLEVSDDSYLETIKLAVEGGAEVVVTPGFLFEASVYAAQTLYPDVKFILIDGEPHTADYATYATESNTLAIMFNEHEAGFLAGYAAVQDGYTELGFIGGMAVPAVVKFGIGFVAGAFYAADEMELAGFTFAEANYAYLGSFAPTDENKNLAASWYVAGTEVIFAAAGGAGSSVMAAALDEGAVMIGVDIDQAGQSTTVLTSAMKQLANAVQQGLQTWLDDAWVGGVTVYKSAANDGVALPMATSRFATFTNAQYEAIFADLVDGTVVVPANYDALVTFLTALGAVEGDYPSRTLVTGVVPE